jgi:hypothetical protein
MVLVESGFIERCDIYLGSPIFVVVDAEVPIQPISARGARLPRADLISCPLANVPAVWRPFSLRFTERGRAISLISTGPADALANEADIHLNTVGDLDERDAAVHAVVLAVKSYSAVFRSAPLHQRLTGSNRESTRETI